MMPSFSQVLKPVKKSKTANNGEMFLKQVQRFLVAQKIFWG